MTGKTGLKAHERQKMKRKTLYSSFSLDFLFPCQAREENLALLLNAHNYTYNVHNSPP